MAESCNFNVNLTIKISYLFISGWIPVIRNEYIPWDLESKPLQISVKQNVGSDDRIVVLMYTEQQEFAGSLVLKFSSPPQYHFGRCTSTYQTLSTNLPAVLDKIITIYRTSEALKIECNGEEIINLVLSDNMCPSSGWQNYWAKDIEMINFNVNDKASERYRAKPGNY